jgi:hypothetical protein
VFRAFWPGLFFLPSKRSFREVNGSGGERNQNVIVVREDMTMTINTPIEVARSIVKSATIKATRRDARLTVIQHHCRHNCAPDDGLPFSFCRCATKVTFREACQLVAARFAVWKLQRNTNGNIVDSKAAIVMLRDDDGLVFAASYRLRPRKSDGTVVMQRVCD